jgi:hypothetical protein
MSGLIGQFFSRGVGKAWYMQYLSPDGLIMLPLLIISAQWVFSVLCLLSSAVIACVRYTMPLVLYDLCQNGLPFGCFVCLVCLVLIRSNTGRTVHHLSHTALTISGGWSIIYATACVVSVQPASLSVVVSLLISTYGLLLPLIAVNYCWLMVLQCCTYIWCHVLDRQHAAAHRLQMSMRLSDTRVFVAYSLIPASVCLVALNAGAVYP